MTVAHAQQQTKLGFGSRRHVFNSSHGAEDALEIANKTGLAKRFCDVCVSWNTCVSGGPLVCTPLFCQLPPALSMTNASRSPSHPAGPPHQLHPHLRPHNTHQEVCSGACCTCSARYKNAAVHAPRTQYLRHHCATTAPPSEVSKHKTEHFNH